MTYVCVYCVWCVCMYVCVYVWCLMCVPCVLCVFCVCCVCSVCVVSVCLHARVIVVNIVPVGASVPLAGSRQLGIENTTLLVK